MTSERHHLPETSPQADSLMDLLKTAEHMPSGEPETYGATPLDPSIAQAQQREVFEKLRVLVDNEIPTSIPEDVVTYIQNTFPARFQGRSVANQENYLSALHTRNEYDGDEVLQQLFDDGETGRATPAQLLIMRKLLGIRSVELACLTHPYGKRMETLDEMRESVKQNVTLMGGDYYEEPVTRYRAKALVSPMGTRPDHSVGIFMTRKRTLGMMPDGTIIKERSSFVLRTDQDSTVSADDVARLNQLDQWHPNWQDDAVTVGRLDEHAAVLLGDDHFDLAIPVSSTIYAYCPETTKQIEARDDAAREARRAQFQRELEQKFPAISEAIAEADRKRVATGQVPIQDIDGMVYINRSDTSR